MTTTINPTDENKVNAINPFDLDDIATEIRCLSSNVFLVSKLVEPREMQEIDTPTEKTIAEAFNSIIMNAEHIAERLENITDRLMKEQKKTATLTDESKDCR